MKITICGSIVFHSEMKNIAQKLKELGHEVRMPTSDADQDKSVMMREHYEKINWCDVVVIANYTRKGIEGYIGANTLMEMGVAFYLCKKIFLIHDIPVMYSSEEIRGMDPIVIEDDLERIK